MAVRRPSPPRLQAGRPGARPESMTPSTPAPAAAPAPAPAAAPEPSPVRPVGGSRSGRRAVLLAGAAAAVVVPMTAVALLRREQPGTLSAGSAQSAPGAVAEAPFEDVAAEDPGAAAIRWAHETGVQPALTATEYGPDRAVTRGDVAVALHRLAGAPAVDIDAAPALLTDLGEDSSQVTALLWLHGRGALWGDAELRVRPGDPATRDCAAQMLAALLRPALAGVGVSWDASAEASLPQSEDLGSALPDVAWLVAAGMVPDSLTAADWAGTEGVTRADLAGSLHRADTVIADALA